MLGRAKMSPKTLVRLLRNGPSSKIRNANLNVSCLYFLLLLWNLPLLSASLPSSPSASPSSKPKTSDAAACLTEVDYMGIYAVNCSNGGLKRVPQDLRANLWTLDLNHNRIFLDIPVMQFAKYESLRKLLLRNNSIAEIHTNAFTGLVSLITLDLHSNKITDVPTEALRSLPALQTLILSANSIQHIGKGAFPDLPYLAELRIDGNHLFIVDDYALSSLINLQHLSIQNNAVKTLSNMVFHNFGRGLLSLDLYNNPWLCDCHIRWMRDWIIKRQIHWERNTKRPICAGPYTNKDKYFTLVPGRHFACKVIMYSSGTSLTLQEGHNVSLICKLYSDPPAEIMWLRNEEKVTSGNGHYEIVEYGDVIKSLALFIKGFSKGDAGLYKCLAKNPIGVDSITYTLSLDEDNPNRLALEMETQGSIFGAKAAIIFAAVVVLVIIVLLTILLVFRHMRNQRKRREKIRLTIEDFFDKNGTAGRQESKMRGRASDQIETGEMDPLYETVANEGNYVSFKSDPVDSEDVSQLYSPSTVTTHMNDSQSDLEPNDASFWLSESASPLLGPVSDDQSTPLHQNNNNSHHLSLRGNKQREVPLTTFPRTAVGSYSSFRTGSPRFVASNRRHPNKNNNRQLQQQLANDRQQFHQHHHNKNNNNNNNNNNDDDDEEEEEEEEHHVVVEAVNNDNQFHLSKLNGNNNNNNNNNINNNVGGVGSIRLKSNTLGRDQLFSKLYSSKQNPNFVYNASYSAYDPIYNKPPSKGQPYAYTSLPCEADSKQSLSTYTSPQCTPKDEKNKRCSSLGNVGIGDLVPPRKPPGFYSGSSMSAQSAGDLDDPISSPLPGSTDEFGTAV